MYSEENFLQLSALQHFVFCKRQCAFIHIEQSWSENVLTAEGRIMHKNVHTEHSENLDGVKIVRGMSLHSFELGLSGKADIVEFHKTKNCIKSKPFPVEYKRGKPKVDDSDKIQLCALSLCLEEMMKIKIDDGALFYGEIRHRVNVGFNDFLRQKTIKTAIELHNFIKNGKTPPPLYTPKCKSCSFVDECLPKAISRKVSIKEYCLREIVKQ